MDWTARIQFRSQPRTSRFATVSRPTREPNLPLIQDLSPRSPSASTPMPFPYWSLLTLSAKLLFQLGGKTVPCYDHPEFTVLYAAHCGGTDAVLITAKRRKSKRFFLQEPNSTCSLVRSWFLNFVHAVIFLIFLIFVYLLHQIYNATVWTEEEMPGRLKSETTGSSTISGFSLALSAEMAKDCLKTSG